MTGVPREEAVAVLLQALPADVSNRVLSRLKPAVAERLRTRLQSSKGPAPADRLDSALREFTDLQRIVERPRPAVKDSVDRPDGTADANEPDGADPLKVLPTLEVDSLFAALTGEQPPTIAVILTCLPPSAAADLLKRFPSDVRTEVALRSGRPAPRNRAIMERIARAIVAKCRASTASEPEPTDDDRVRRLVTLLRALSRAERLSILQQLGQTDPATAEKVDEQLYQFDDLLHIENRPMQALLAELDMKTLALALNGADEAIRTKVLANLSSRAREGLAEEAELLGNPPKVKIEAARASALAVLRRFEEEGKLTIES